MHSSLGRRCGMLAAGALVLSGLGVSGAVAADPQTTSTVVGSDAWYTQAYENFSTGGYLTPQQSDVTGPQRAPFGTSSHKITIGESSAQTELYRTNAYDGMSLSDLTRLEYSELARHAGDGGADRQPAYLRLSVDNDGTDSTDAIDASLFFFPANNADQQAVVNGTWQTWDVANGNVSVDGDAGPGATTTLADYVSAHPDAVLVNAPFDEAHDAGALSLIVGGSLAGDTDLQTRGEYFVDRVIVGQNDQDTLFDLGGGSEGNGDIADLTIAPGQLQGWQHQAYDDVVYLPDSKQSFVDGPGTPLAGGGSLQVTLDSDENPERVELFRTTQYDGTLLRDLREASYSTYVKGDTGNATPQQPAYMRLSLDNDGDDTTDSTLFYFPANNGTVQQSTWQNWSAADGLWNVGSDTGIPGAITLEDYLVAHPDARIVVNADSSALDQPQGGVAFLVGASGANQMNGTFNLDDITIAKVDDETGQTVSGKAFNLEPTAPTLAIGDASVSEGNSGATLTFPVTLSREFPADATVQFTTSNGTAKSGSDYRATSGTVTIPAGSTTATVSVPVLSDKVHEANETFTVDLSSPVNATLGDGSAVGTVIDEDTEVGLALHRAKEHRVRVVVKTGPVAGGATVKVYRVLKSGEKRVLKSTLDSSGAIKVRLGHHYRPGKLVTMVATVKATNGLYRSETDQIRIRR
jgi:hypothetical protein